jgi:very-short-patch-repair endonuclease
LRRKLTTTEAALWARVRTQQLLSIQSYRQKPTRGHFVDFFAPRANLIVEGDRSQGLEAEHALKDRSRGWSLVSKIPTGPPLLKGEIRGKEVLC